jgi:sec-independent protein translocase protein TatA
MYANILSPEILIVLVVVGVLFGGSKLPELARSLGSAKSEFEKGQRGDDVDDDDDEPVVKKAKADTTDDLS